jgi:uncharacterized protein (DUF608 family)
MGLSAAAALASGVPVMAGPFEASDFEKLVPADKKLSPEWVKSLFARGRRTIYRGAELDKIGMPIGGICAGQLYLGGDGRLWHWDVRNQRIKTGPEHYATPMKPTWHPRQGFGLMIYKDGKAMQTCGLDRDSFPDVTFCGEYPIARIEYRNPSWPVTISLEAFSPFIPLNVDDSSLPATIMRFTVKNVGSERVECAIVGWLDNMICGQVRQVTLVHRRNRIVRRPEMTLVQYSAERDPNFGKTESKKPDIIFEDFEKPTYEGWTVTGTAFGDGPMEKAKMPAYQGDVGAQGNRLVNTHNTRRGEDVRKGDAHTGTLTSKPFLIERQWINFLIGGGDHPDQTCINLLVDDKVVHTATGQNENRMSWRSFYVGTWKGKQAQIQIVDRHTGGWGNIGIDQIVFSDKPAETPSKLEESPDFGTMAFAMLGSRDNDFGVTLPLDIALPTGLPALPSGRGFAQHQEATAEISWGYPPLTGYLGRKMTLEPGQADIVTFLICWHFPNFRLDGLRDKGGRRYANRFDSATAVAEYVAKNFDRLRDQTRLWHDTWYDSTLPRWFLDRTFLNTSILATSTCHWFKSGRFWGWEGVGCCHGTCAHVWQYAHAVARLFPQLERSVREMADFGVSFDPATGAIRFRGEFNDIWAADGQAGRILSAYREHQMSADDAFLKRNWPHIKKALEFLIEQDGNDDGILEGKQHNTLDTDWYGPVAWLSGLYLAALRAGEEMAREVGDEEFAKRSRGIFEKGSKKIVEVCWNGEYFIHKPDPGHPEAMKSGNGCEIDQVFGQSWAFQVGLGRIIDEAHVKKALQSLWKYNFTPDVGLYRAVHKSGRWYAMPGEAGLLMCTWPKGDRKDTQGKAPDWAYGYFNECMNGFEYQVAGHMIWEGMVEEGLAIARAVHDRYHASRRNPWNEIECGDHYARSMASYGVFLAACGYDYHGPHGHIGFAPRLTPEDFRAAFTAAEGWGTFSQKIERGKMKAEIAVKWGRLRVRTLAFSLIKVLVAPKVMVVLYGKPIKAAHTFSKEKLVITLASDLIVQTGETLEISVS